MDEGDVETPEERLLKQHRREKKDLQGTFSIIFCVVKSKLVIQPFITKILEGLHMPPVNKY